MKVLGPYTTGDGTSITIEFPSFPNSRSAFVLFGNGNGVPVLAIASYEATANTAYITYILPTSESEVPLGLNGNQITINNLRTWSYLYVLVPWL